MPQAVSNDIDPQTSATAACVGAGVGGGVGGGEGAGVGVPVGAEVIGAELGGGVGGVGAGVGSAWQGVALFSSSVSGKTSVALVAAVRPSLLG